MTTSGQLPLRLQIRFWYRRHLFWPGVYAWQNLLRAIKPRGNRRHILLVGKHAMSTQYLRGVQNLLQDDSRIHFAFASDPKRGEPDLGPEIADDLNLPLVPLPKARLTNWDMLVFTDHHQAHRFNPGIPKLQVYHSLSGGKIVDGKNYRFDADTTMYNGQNLYTAIFVPSQSMHDRAVQINPALAGRLHVVGDLGVDRLLEENRYREAIRHEFGFKRDDTVVLIQSTFRESSLFERMGHDILQAASNLTKRYRFILSTHPAHWSGTYAELHPWGRRLLEQESKGFTIVRPGEPWEKYAIASDMCLSDHTGLACNYAVLGKPIIMINLPAKLLVDGSDELLVYNAVPHMKSADQLGEMLDKVQTEYPAEQLKSVANQIVSCPGQAAELMGEELYRLLNLQPPVRGNM